LGGVWCIEAVIPSDANTIASSLESCILLSSRERQLINQPRLASTNFCLVGQTSRLSPQASASHPCSLGGGLRKPTFRLPPPPSKIRPDATLRHTLI
jgi:hypothetical protein